MNFFMDSYSSFEIYIIFLSDIAELSILVGKLLGINLVQVLPKNLKIIKLIINMVQYKDHNYLSLRISELNS